MTIEERLEERLKRIEQFLAGLSLNELDLNRAYNDREVCLLLGGVSRSTLWRIRKAGLLDSVTLIPANTDSDGAVNRTTGRQIAEYLRGCERASDVLNFTGTGRRRGQRAAS